MTKCCMSKDIDIYAKHGSKEDIAKLNAVSKALKASSIFKDASLERPLHSSVLITTGFSIVLGRIIVQLLN